jgi:hypothetical protein
MWHQSSPGARVLPTDAGTAQALGTRSRQCLPPRASIDTGSVLPGVASFARSCATITPGRERGASRNADDAPSLPPVLVSLRWNHDTVGACAAAALG